MIRHLSRMLHVKRRLAATESSRTEHFAIQTVQSFPHDVSLETSCEGLASSVAKATAPILLFDQHAQRVGKSKGVALWYEQSSLPVLDGLADPADIGCNHGQPRSHCFENTDGKHFALRCENEDVRLDQQLRHIFAFAEKFNPSGKSERSYQLLHLDSRLSVAHQPKTRTLRKSGKCADQLFMILSRGKASHHRNDGGDISRVARQARRVADPSVNCDDLAGTGDAVTADEIFPSPGYSEDAIAPACGNAFEWKSQKACGSRYRRGTPKPRMDGVDDWNSKRPCRQASDEAGLEGMDVNQVRLLGAQQCACFPKSDDVAQEVMRAAQVRQYVHGYPLCAACRGQESFFSRGHMDLAHFAHGARQFKQVHLCPTAIGLGYDVHDLELAGCTRQRRSK